MVSGKQFQCKIQKGHIIDTNAPPWLVFKPTLASYILSWTAMLWRQGHRDMLPRKTDVSEKMPHEQGAKSYSQLCNRHSTYCTCYVLNVMHSDPTRYSHFCNKASRIHKLKGKMPLRLHSLWALLTGYRLGGRGLISGRRKSCHCHHRVCVSPNPRPKRGKILSPPLSSREASTCLKRGGFGDRTRK